MHMFIIKLARRVGYEVEEEEREKCLDDASGKRKWHNTHGRCAAFPLKCHQERERESSGIENPLRISIRQKGRWSEQRQPQIESQS